MVENLIAGRKYETIATYTLQSTGRYDLYFSSSTWFINDKEVRRIKKSTGEALVECYDANGRYIDDSSTIPIFQFVMETTYLHLPTTIVGVISEVIPVITENVSNCTIHVISTPAHFNEKLEYIFVADNGYSLVNANVQISINGEDVTNLYYDKNPRDYEVSGVTYTGTRLLIPLVNDDVIIDLDSIAIVQLDINYDSDNVLSVHPNNTNYGEETTIEIITDEGFSFDEYPTIQIGSENITNQCEFIPTYYDNYVELQIVVPSYLVSGDIDVYAYAIENPSISYELVGVTDDGTTNYPFILNEGETISVDFTLENGYSFDEIEIRVTHGGVDIPFNHSISGTNLNITLDSPLTKDIKFYVTAKKLNTFNFYEKDNTTIAGTYTGIRITKLLVERTGNDVNIVINDNEDVISYTEELTAQETFNGLTLNAGSILVYIPVGVQTNVNFETDTNFYEVIKNIPIVPTDFKLYFYKNGAESNKVDKTNDLSFVAEVTGTLRMGTSIINPIFNIEITGVPNFNYVYVPFFNRYYYVREITSINQNLWQISMNVDVLMSFKDTIRSQVALISRQENDYNNDIEDNERIMMRKPNIEIAEIPNTIFNNTDEGASLSVDKGLRYVISVVKGK